MPTDFWISAEISGKSECYRWLDTNQTSGTRSAVLLLRNAVEWCTAAAQPSVAVLSSGSTRPGRRRWKRLLSYLSSPLLTYCLCLAGCAAQRRYSVQCSVQLRLDRFIVRVQQGDQAIKLSQLVQILILHFQVGRRRAL